MVRCSSWQLVAVFFGSFLCFFVLLFFLVVLSFFVFLSGSWLFLVIISGYLCFMVALGGYWCSWWILVLFDILGGSEKTKLVCCTLCTGPYPPLNGN